MSKDKRDFSNPKKLLAIINREKDKAKMKIDKIQSMCYHQNKDGNLWVHRRKKDPDSCRCRECRKKINIKWMDAKREDLRDTIKQAFKDVDNMINTTKIQMVPKTDRKELDYLGQVQYGLKRAKRLVIACCVDSFEPHKGKKKNKKRKNKKGKKGLRLGTQGRSIGFGRKGFRR